MCAAVVAATRPTAAADVVTRPMAAAHVATNPMAAIDADVVATARPGLRVLVGAAVAATHPVAAPGPQW